MISFSNRKKAPRHFDLDAKYDAIVTVRSKINYFVAPCLAVLATADVYGNDHTVQNSLNSDLLCEIFFWLTSR